MGARARPGRLLQAKHHPYQHFFCFSQEATQTEEKEEIPTRTATHSYVDLGGEGRGEGGGARFLMFTEGRLESFILELDLRIQVRRVG